MNNREQEKVANENPKGSFWLGFLIGSFTNVFGFIGAFFVKKIKIRKGMIAGAVFVLLAAIVVIVLAP